MSNLKITLSNNSMSNNSYANQRRLSADNSQLGSTNGFGRNGRNGRNSRCFRSQLSIDESNTTNTTQPKQQSIRKPVINSTKSEIPRSCRCVNTWSFKQR